MKHRKKTISLLLVLVVSLMLVVLIHPAKAQVVLNKAFVPSAATYTNKTMHFQVADPYDGYDYWTYAIGDGLQGASDNRYVIQTETTGDARYFGFDEFVNHSVVSAEVILDTSALDGTYHIQPLAYFYQKTNLESNTRWALAIDWDSSGIDLYYNTGNGNTPTSVNLVGTAISLGTDYNITLSNLGVQTFVEIQDISSYPTYPIIYSGYTTTGVYDATSLYAGFGQYSTGSGDINGWWDDFTIIDSTFTYPENGTGFNKIDAYLDEVFTQTLYDMDGGVESSVDVAESVTNITLLVSCWLNSTTYGISTLAEGKNIIRLNVTVTATNHTLVFSQNNLTYISSTDYGDNVFLYQYSVQLDFTIISGNIYTVVLTYEIYY